MAKGSGSDYENLEDEENSNDNYCEPGDGFTEFGTEGDSEVAYDDSQEDGDEEYRPASKRGRGAASFRSPRGRSTLRNDYTSQSQCTGGTGTRNGSRGSASSRFRGTRGFARGSGIAGNTGSGGAGGNSAGSASGGSDVEMTMFRSGPPDSPNAIGQFNTARGGTRFRSASGWDGEWNVPATNNDAQQGGIPSLGGSMGTAGMPPHMVMNNGYQGTSAPFANPMPQIPGVKLSQESESNEQDSLQAPGVTNTMNSVYGSTTSRAATTINRTSDINDFTVIDESNIEIWVETKTADGKSYYYNAKSRDTTWTKPEGENIKIILQEQVEAMAAAAGVSSTQQHVSHQNNSEESSEAVAMNMTGNMNLPHMTGSGPGPGPGGPAGNMPPPNTMQPPPGMMPPPFGAPPFGGPPPFGMPPPGFPPSAFPGGFQPTAPWGFPQPGMSMQSPMMPPNVMAPQQQMAPPGAYAPGLPMPMGGMEPYDDRIMAEIDPNILNRAAEWSEHKAPDGRSYYYNMKVGESVWEKPQALKDLDAARLAALASRNNPSVIDKPSLEMSNSGGLTASSSVGIHSTLDAKQNISVDKKSIDEFEKSVDEKHNEHSIEEERKTRNRTSDDHSAEYESEDSTAATKKKVEDEEKHVPKVQDKSKPVSSTPVPGTPWCVVWTGDGRVFFYNPSARTSVWERPEELVGRFDVTKMISTPPAVVVALKKESQDSTDGTVPAKKAKLESGNQELEERTASVSSKEEQKLSSATTISSVSASITSEKHQINVGKEAAMEAEVRAARERAVVPLETRISSFREMLAEKEVSAFSTWEKELHKIVFDPRYLLLTSKERKQVFEKYVKERAEEERQEKRNRMKQRKEDYRKLMEEANLHGKSSFNDFASKYAKDERFKNIEKMRERESLFNEFILEVRKREKDEKNHRREQIRKDFIELLREHTEIDRHSRWSDVKKKIDSDSRYRMVDSSSLREDYFREYIRMLKDEKRHKEKERSRKEKVEKDRDQESDPELANASDTERDKEAEKAARVEASLREREKEVQRTLAVHLRDRDNEREQHKHDEAVHHFNALLADLVRNSELSWREVKRQLRKDHRWDLVDLLDRDEKEKLFNEHIEQLTKKKREKFRELLDETHNITLNSSWKEVRRLIKDDPRYVKFSSNERKCEKEFKEYMKDKLVTIKSDFRELLQETKLISHKSYSLVKENDNYLKEIEDILKNDRRYLILDHIPEERKELLLTYLEDLEKRGPPPPPTASEPSRRIIK